MARHGRGPILLGLTVLALAPLIIILTRIARRRRHGPASAGAPLPAGKTSGND
jgi:hypothetical protein